MSVTSLTSSALSEATEGQVTQLGHNLFLPPPAARQAMPILGDFCFHHLRQSL